MVKLKKAEVVGAALESGFIISTAHGQNHNQFMPVTDVSTLMEFYKNIEKLRDNYEKDAKS